MRPWPVLLMVRALSHGGTERQVAELARSLDRSRFQPHVGCFVDQGFRADELRTAGIPLFHTNLRGFFRPDNIQAFREMRAYVRRHQIRLVHTFDHIMNIFGVPAARLMGVPVVLSSQRSFRSLLEPKYVPMVRFGDRFTDGIVVNCRAVRQHLIDEYRIAPEKIRVCYNAIDTHRFHLLPRNRPAELAGAPLVIGIVSVIRATKRHDLLLKAFAAVRTQIPGAKLLVVGSGPDEATVKQRAVELGIAADCHFHPSVHDVTPWLQAIDIFVLPTENEALSNSLMEAMACGCCAVASRVGGNPELIEHGETGLLFESGNVEDLCAQLLRAAADTTLRTTLAANGSRSIVERFHTQASVAAMEQVYEEFLDRARRD